MDIPPEFVKSAMVIIVSDKSVFLIALSCACAAGNYLTIPRTEGISTTAIVGRILTHLKNQSAPREDHDVCRTSSTGCDLDLLSSLIHGKSNFLTTTRMLRLFSENVKVRIHCFIDKLLRLTTFGSLKFMCVLQLISFFLGCRLQQKVLVWCTLGEPGTFYMLVTCQYYNKQETMVTI